MKKVISIILMLCLMLSMGVVAFAEEPKGGTLVGYSDNVAKIGETYYTDLHTAMTSAKSGETVELVSDVDLAGTEWEPVSFKGKFNGNGYSIKNLTINKPGVSNIGFITSLNGTFENVTFTNPTVTGGECTGVLAGRAGGSAALAKNITVNGTIKVETTHSGYARAAVIVGGWAYGNYENITVDGGDKEVSYVKHTGGGDGRYVAGIVGHADDVESYKNCTVKNITISGGWLCGGIAGPGPSDGLASECSVENINVNADYSGGMFGWYYGDGTIEDSSVKDVTFTAGSTKNGAIGGYSENPNANLSNMTIENVKNADGKDLLASAVASIGNKYYGTLKDAIAAVDSGDVVIELHEDATLDYNARETYGTENTTSLTINGNGHTLTLNQKDSDWSSLGLENPDAKLVLKNMTVEKTGYGDTSGAWNTHAIIVTSKLDMENVIVNNSVAVEKDTNLKTVTINEANGYYGLWITADGQTVNAEDLEINATNGGRGIKIADEYVNDIKKVTLNVKDSVFTTAKKAAVLVSSKGGADVTAENVNIEKVDEDKVNFVWVDENWKEHFSAVTVNGGTAYIEGKPAGGDIIRAYLNENKDRITVDLENITFYDNVVLKLYSGDKLLTTAELNTQKYGPGYYNGDFTGSIGVTDLSSDSWHVEKWTPSEGKMPNKVVLVVDGNEVDSTDKIYNGNPDNNDREEMDPKDWGNIEGIEHDWVVSYEWSDDGKSCVATRVCKIDAEHKESATATISSEVAKAETCTEKGETKYTATFAVDWATTQSKTVVDIPATGHDMADATCTKPSTCKNGCGHTEGKALGHDYGRWVTVEEPTETEGGRKVRTCSVCGQKTSKYVKPLSEDGITIITPSDKGGEENPNTGAPVMMPVVAVLAALSGAVVFKRK